MNKESNINFMIDNYYNKTINMFHYSNLPDSIPENQLEYMLQRNGKIIFTNSLGGEYYIFNGSYLGQDVYGNPTSVLITNHLLGSKELVIDEECIIIKNDYMETGMQPLFLKYSTLLSEVDISLLLANYNTRIQTLISATDDETIQSAMEYLESIKQGNLGVIAENKLFDSLNVHNKTATNSYIKDLIELQQYLKATSLNELGLNSNYNMKRERLNTSETDMNSDVLYPLASNMLDCRKIAIEEINALYGLDITVELTSTWKLKQLELENLSQQMETEIRHSPEESEEVIEEETEEVIEEETEEVIEEETEEVIEEESEEVIEEESEEVIEEDSEEVIEEVNEEEKEESRG